MSAHLSTQALSVDRTATFLGVSRRQVYVLLETDPTFREIAHRVGKRWRWFVPELEQWLRSRCSATTAESAAA